MAIIPEKFQPVTFLPSRDEAIKLVDQYREWAATARRNDQYGSARQFELMVLLLMHYIDNGA